MAGNAVFGISKTLSTPSTSSRIDLSVGGLANILSGPQWNGLHFNTPDTIVSNAITGFPRAFTYWAYDQSTNPTYLNFNILTGNSGGVSGGANSNMILGTFEAGNVALYTTNTERMRINSAGNVGIGTTGPSAKLDVAGEARAATAATGTANTMLATTAFVGTADTNVVVPPFLQANNAFNVANAAFTAANVAYGRIQLTANTGDLLANGINTPVTGNILLGLATTAVTAATYGGTTAIPVFTVDTKGRLTYAANVASPAVTITDDTTTDATRYPLFAAATSGTLSTAYTGSTDLTFNPATGTLSAVIFTSLSDEAQKTNIKPIQNALNIVENIKGVTFDWKESSLPSAGLLAQDVEKYLPQLIENVDDKKTLNYNGVIGVLVEAIKELNEKVKQLENKE